MQSCKWLQELHLLLVLCVANILGTLGGKSPESSGRNPPLLLARQLKQRLRSAAIEASNQQLLARKNILANWVQTVEASRCSTLLRARVLPGAVLDLGSGGMLTAWLLGLGRPVVAATGSAPLSPELENAPGLVHIAGESLANILDAFRILGEVPGLLFLQPSLVLGDRAGGAASTAGPREWDGIGKARKVFPALPVAGAMLTSDGRELPHWAIPSLLAPVLGSENDVMVELPCWAAGGCPRGAAKPLLSLVMIVKDEARRIKETIESVIPVASRAVILDTGSTDGTQQIIRRTCRKTRLQLELHEEQFVDFSTTRNRALQLAGNSTEFVLMLSGDETLVRADQLRVFLEQHSGYCGVSEDLFNLRVLMGPNTWYWSERLMRSGNHADPSWPSGNDTWRYVGVTHEAYVNPVKTMQGDLFIQYVGDTDPSRAVGMPTPVAGSFHVSHDADRPPVKHRRRLWQDVRLLEGYLDQANSSEDRWQYSRSIFYLAQSHRSLGFSEAARDLWERYLSLEIAKLRTFSYLVYGAHLGLGQICAEAAQQNRQELGVTCREHFEEAFKLCPRVEPLMYLALALPVRDRQRLEVLQRAEKVAHLQHSTGHCAVFAEPGLYAQLPGLMQEARGSL